MSRSKRKTPIFGNCNLRSSEKQDKRKYNRRYRRACKTALHKNPLTDLLPNLKEHSNPWSMNKDGRGWVDVKGIPRMMRK
jgi:hypothetical protein